VLALQLLLPYFAALAHEEPDRPCGVAGEEWSCPLAGYLNTTLGERTGHTFAVDEAVVQWDEWQGATYRCVRSPALVRALVDQVDRHFARGADVPARYLLGLLVRGST
jgi:hypothetical protein